MWVVRCEIIFLFYSTIPPKWVKGKGVYTTAQHCEFSRALRDALALPLRSNVVVEIRWTSVMENIFPSIISSRKRISPLLPCLLPAARPRTHSHQPSARRKSAHLRRSYHDPKTVHTLFPWEKSFIIMYENDEHTFFFRSHYIFEFITTEYER